MTLMQLWNWLFENDIENLIFVGKVVLSILIEHNLFKNVSNWVTFLWEMQIQTIKYGLNDTKMIKKKEFTLKLYSFTISSDMNFLTIVMPKIIFAKSLSQKIYSLEPFLS